MQATSAIADLTGPLHTEDADAAWHASADPRSCVTEVGVRWGDTTLALEHLPGRGSFHLDERAGRGPSFVVPEGTIDGGRAPLVLWRAGRAVAIVPDGARGELTLPGRAPLGLREAAARGLSSPTTEAPASREIALAPGTTLRFSVGGLELTVARVSMPRRGPSVLLAAAVMASGACVFASMFGGAGLF
jgi:hypothetical protein